jgi:hypothetical protein
MAKLKKKAGEAPKFEPFALTLEFYDPEDAEHFLQGMIVARSNNSNETIVEIIDGINESLAEYRGQKVLHDVRERDEG